MAHETPNHSRPLPLADWGGAQAASDDLWKVVLPDAMYARPVPERHRLVFYLGHLEAFDWNLLAPALGLEPFHAEWDKLFAFGIDPVAGELPQDQPRDWPAIAEVSAYGRGARERVDEALRRVENGASLSGSSDLATRLHVAIEHRWMHVETLAYLFHNLDYSQKRPAAEAVSDRVSGVAGTVSEAPVRVPKGRITLGRERNGVFGWDNEFDAHEVEVPELGVDRYKVTNGEYLQFVESGAEAPHFWRRRGKEWVYRGMFAEVPLPLEDPAYVTHEQAAAYAAWKGKELPTEAEWQRIAYGTPEGGERAFPWGEAEPAAAFGNFDFQTWDPQPVRAHPEGASAWGVEDLLGNGWEWTSSRFGPFPGFEPMPFYPGYSANFFDGKHYVIKGASARTARCFLRNSFRNWFQPRYPYVYAAFRCVVH